MFIPRPRHEHISEVIRLLMHSLTSIAKSFLPLGLATKVSARIYFGLFSDVSTDEDSCSYATDSADLGRPSEAMIDRRLRLASSSPDVKALFNNSPSYFYQHVEEEEDYDAQPNYVPGTLNSEYWPPTPIVSPSALRSFQYLILLCRVRVYPLALATAKMHSNAGLTHFSRRNSRTSLRSHAPCRTARNRWT